jgi:hypothetical protein
VTPFTGPKTQDQWVIEWALIPNAPASTWDRYQWFFNPTKPTSMRLSKIGATWLSKKTTFPFHIIKLDKQITPKMLLQLERLLTEPYYIKDLTELWVHSETDAIMLTLHAGNLAAYLDNLQDNK